MLFRSAVFNTGKTFFNTSDFLSAYIEQARVIDAQEMVIMLEEQFGIELGKWKIVEKINKDSIYYDPVMNKLYADYDTFVKTSETFFIQGNS